MNKFLTVQAGWELIQEIGWGTKTTDYKAIAEEYFTKLGKDGMALLEKFVNERRAQLSLAIDSWEETYGKLELGSDDSYSDLTYHIVGLGPEHFNDALQNPVRAQERYCCGAYKESFAYCFQQPDPPRTKAQAKVILKHLLDQINQVDKKIEVLDKQISDLKMMAREMNLYATQVKVDFITAKQ